jgi:hypothetical protein
MIGGTQSLLRITFAAAVGIGCLFVSEKISLTQPDSLVTKAHAIIGRPLTPLSYAGVARRTTRRAYYGAAVYGAPVYGAPVYGAPVYAAPVYPAPVYATPGCVQVVNVYGQISYRCP